VSEDVEPAPGAGTRPEAGAGGFGPSAASILATATIDAAVAATVAAIALNALSAPVIVLASVGSLIFVASWGALMAMQRLTMRPLRK
jgi:hypothetical protein